MSLPDSASYVGLFLLVFLGEAGVPVPAPVELALVAAGVAFADHPVNLGALAIIAVTADLLGTLCLFGLVRTAMRGERPPGLWRRALISANRFASRIGAEDPRRVAAGRAVPFLRVPTAGAAALAGVSARQYAVCALVGGLVWTTIFMGGAMAVSRWPW